jgi:hypothetical protein
MSQLAPSIVTCPRCAATWSMTQFTSVDADTIQVEVDAILAGTFEQQTCSGCGHGFRAEHNLLFVSHARRLWIVMYPLAERADFAALEEAVARSIAESFAQATPLVAERLRGVRPRLVFGQHMLSDAVRAAYAGIDVSVLECAKLLTVRRNMAQLMAHGPFELCLERFGERGAPVCAIHALPGGERLGEIELRADILAEARASLHDMRLRFPDLFERPYASATRYMIGATV